MPELELEVRLIREKNFTALENELQAREILYLSTDQTFTRPSARFKMLIFFEEDRTRILEKLKFLGIKSYSHPSMKNMKFSHEEIYNKIFKNKVSKILKDIGNLKSIFHQNHSVIKKEIIFLSNEIDKAINHLGDKFLDVHESRHNMTLGQIIAKMEKFAKKTPLR